MIRCLAVLLLVAVATGSHLTDPVFDEEWVDFKNFYNKIYENEHEELVRRLIWERNVQYIDKHNLKANLGSFTYILGVNEYTDMTNTEFVKLMNGFLNLNLTRSPNSFTSTDISDLPAEVDWRTKGYVTPVKNQSCGQMERVYSLIQDEQLVPVRFSYATVSPLINRQEFLRKGQCGSCWAFSTTGSLEGQHFKATGRLVSLSEQNLVDCSTAEGNLGCSGGLMDNAFTYIKKNHGVDTEASYPYKAKNGRCHFKKGHIGATDTGYTDIQTGSEFALQKAVATVGPISVAIDASHPSFQLYRSGVYVEDECSTVLLDHGVLAVGYGTSDGQDYWLVKNSWGATWGKDGYIMMARNHNNMCGIATSASYPNV